MSMENWKTMIQQRKKLLMMFGNMIADMGANKKLGPIVTELVLREIKLNIFLAFISQSYFKVPKTKRLNAAYYFIMKIPNKTELQQIGSNYSSDIEFKYLTIFIFSE